MSDYAIAEFDSYEIDKFIDKLQEKIKSIENGEKVYQSILSSTVFKDISDHFKDELGSKGPWDDWSKSYSDFMFSIGKSGNKILQDTGRLRNSIQPGKTSSNGISWVNPAKTKSGFPYAFAHNEGGRKLPKRDFMWLSDDAMEDIGKKTLAFILDEK